MTDRELMQMALDALIETVRLAGEYGTHLIRNDKDAGHAYSTIEALRAALAQPELVPVAWCIIENGRVHGLVKNKPAVMNAEKWQPLYTAPPQRVWQGLTDEEVGVWTVFDGLHHVEVPLLADFARAIENKLKEKNI